MPARRDHHAVPTLAEIAEALGELGGVALGRAPRCDAQVETFGELGEPQLHPAVERIVERAQRTCARPLDRLGERLGFLVCLTRAVERCDANRPPRPTRLRAAAEPAWASRRTAAARAIPRLPRTIRRPGAGAGRRTGPRAPVRARAPGRAGRRRGSALGPAARRPRRSCRWTAAWTGRIRGATRSHRPRTPGAPDAARCRGRRRPRRRAPRTRRGAPPRRPACSRGRRAARPGRRARAPCRTPAAAAVPCPAWGSRPASRRARARPARTAPSLRGAGGGHRPGEPRPRARARSARTAGLPTPAAGRRGRPPGTRRRRPRAPRLPADRPSRRAPGTRARWRRRRSRSPDRPRPAPGSGRARSSSSRSNGSEATRSPGSPAGSSHAPRNTTNRPRRGATGLVQRGDSLVVPHTTRDTGPIGRGGHAYPRWGASAPTLPSGSGVSITRLRRIPATMT